MSVLFIAANALVRMMFLKKVTETMATFVSSSMLLALAAISLNGLGFRVFGLGLTSLPWYCIIVGTTQAEGLVVGLGAKRRGRLHTLKCKAHLTGAPIKGIWATI